MLNYVKKIWDSPSFLHVAFILLAFFGAKYFLNQFRNDRDSFVERLKEVQIIHDKELEKVLKAQIVERERHEQNLRKLQQDLNAAIAKHEEKLKELENQKEAEVKRIFEKYRNDPSGLAQELGRVTGIPVYIPEAKK